jgi:pimeloyl-ACP methyl ester carboxylesterase
MKGELVSAQTEDRVRLHGLYCAPVSENRSQYEAVVLTHGLAGNFYSSRFLFYLAHSFLDLGLHVVIGNTRGHDDVNRTVRMGRSAYLGAAFESVSDCQYDLAAWNHFLRTRGHERVILAGHSLGAIKSLYAQAYKPQPNVQAIIGLSATRLNHECLMNSSGKEKFANTLAEAQHWVDAGQADRLLEIEFPFPTMMAAGAYLNKYGDENQYDWLGFVEKIKVPTQLIFGQLELEENPAFEGLMDQLAPIKSNPQFSIEVVEGADHFYSARFSQATDCIREWL